MAPAVKKDVYPGDVVMKRVKGAPGWGEQQFKLGTVMSQATSPSAYVNHNSKSFHVMWEQNSRVELSNIHQVGLVNRILSRGTKVKSEDGEEGNVRASRTLATVHVLGTTNVVDKIPTERLKPVSHFVRGQLVMYKGWVGYVMNLQKNVHFVLDGGMGFHIPSTETDGFARTDMYWGPGVTCPGMRSRISGRQMKNAVWTARPLRFITRFFPQFNYLYSMTPCTVMKSEVTQLEMDWLHVAPGIDNPESVRRPPPLILQEDFGSVTIIGEPSSEVLGYNSVRLLQVTPEDNITTLEKWTDFFVRKYADAHDLKEPEKAPIEYYDKIRYMSSAEKPYEVAVKILNLHTVIDVAWNNGETSTIPATKIASATTYDYTGDYPVGMIVAPLYKSPTEGDRYAVVQESGMSMLDDGKGRTGKLKVKWVTSEGAVSELEDVSSFDIRPHTTYSMYMKGSIVFPRKYGEVPFKSGYVTDMDIPEAKLVLVCPSTLERYEVFPHTITPFSTRVYWNFFQTKYMKDTILPPPYQLKVEFSPLRFFPEETPEPPANLLSTQNNNPESIPTKEFCIWDEPSFDLLAFAPSSHRYFQSKESSRGFGKKFSAVMEKEFDAMKLPGAIPEGIWVRAYENRMDLVSVLMVGPSHTLYEEGIFLFDLQLSPNFPSEPPRTHFVSYAMELNPLTSWDGNFCVSSLEWNFALVEEKPASYIANFVAQVQGKLFAKEPFFCDQNKAIDAKNPGVIARSRMYNEQTFIRVLDSIWNMIHFPHQPWEEFIKSHFAATLPSKIAEIQSWDLISLSVRPTEEEESTKHPSYPLAPVCVGFVEALGKRLDKFKKIAPIAKTLSAIKIKTVEQADEVIVDETADSESTPVTEFSMEPSTSTAPAPTGELKVELIEPVNANLKNLVEVEYVEIIETKKDSPREFVTSSPVEEMRHQKMNPRPKSPTPPVRDDTLRLSSRPGSPVQPMREEVQRSRPGSPVISIRETRPGSPENISKRSNNSRPGSPEQSGRSGSPISATKSGSPRAGSPVKSKMSSPRAGSPGKKSKGGSPSLSSSRPGSPVFQAFPQSDRPRSPPPAGAETTSSSRPGSPTYKTPIPTIPDVFKIPARRPSSERTGTADQSVTSGQTGKISAWPVKPQTPEEFPADPDVLAAQGLMSQMKQPLDSLKNVLKKKSKSSSSKSSSKGSSKASKSKSKKRKDKSKKKQKVTGVSSPPGSSIGSGGSGGGSGGSGESDMDETDLDLNRRLATEEDNRPSSPDNDDRSSSIDDHLFSTDPETSAQEEIEAD